MVTALNGNEALSALTATDAPEFALILMDVQMPFMDGIECTRRIRTWEQETKQPHRVQIVALSANGDDEACRRDCMACGMDGVLIKPIEHDTLCDMLGITASPTVSPRPMAAAAPPWPPSAPSWRVG